MIDTFTVTQTVREYLLTRMVMTAFDVELEATHKPSDLLEVTKSSMPWGTFVMDVRDVEAK